MLVICALLDNPMIKLHQFILNISTITWSIISCVSIIPSSVIACHCNFSNNLIIFYTFPAITISITVAIEKLEDCACIPESKLCNTPLSGLYNKAMQDFQYKKNVQEVAMV